MLKQTSIMPFHYTLIALKVSWDPCGKKTKTIMEYLKSGILPDDPVEAHHLDLERPRFSLVDGVLLHEDPGLPGQPQLVVAKQVQEQLV